MNTVRKIWVNAIYFASLEFLNYVLPLKKNI